MTTTNNPIIADTSGLVSLATDTDNNHERAVEEATRLQTSQRIIMLPSAVFVETINVLESVLPTRLLLQQLRNFADRAGSSSGLRRVPLSGKH